MAIIGVFRACSEAQYDIEPKAWKGKFAAQVRVEPIGQLTRVQDAAYILGKAGMGMGQLASRPTQNLLLSDARLPLGVGGERFKQGRVSEK